jgi:hypothetical protein
MQRQIEIEDRATSDQPGRGDVRRAKLYYLRERSGKSARIREKLHGAEKAGAPEQHGTEKLGAPE